MSATAQLRDRSSEKTPEARAAAVQRQMAWRKRNPEAFAQHKLNQQLKNRTDPERIRARRNNAFLRKYGIDLDRYEELYLQQEGCCALCRSEEPTLDVDHCHVSGRVRGLLCRRCNLAVGLLQDSSLTARNLVAYLECEA